MKFGLILRALITLACALLTVTSCTDSRPKPAPVRSVYMGDPADIFAGTTRAEIIPRDFFKTNDLFILQNQFEFKSVHNYDSKKEASSFGVEFQYLEDPDGSAALTSELFKIVLSPVEGGFKIESILSGSKVLPAKLLHFSATPDKKLFSLLIMDSADSKTNKTVTALYFGRYQNELRPAKAIPTRYNYTYGPGSIFRWSKDKQIDLSICQGVDARLLPELRKSLAIWLEALKPSVKVSLEFASAAFPFSDLNQHCISIIDGFERNPDPKFSSYGATYTVSDLETHTFVDVDVFLFKAEFEKGGHPFMSDEVESFRSRTFIHELGHFFGLEHPSGTSPSIMSYDWSLENKLYPYDLQAVGALYAD